LVDETLLTLGRGVPACFLLLRDNNAVLTDAPELSSRLLLSPAPKFVGQDALQLTVDQSALALLVRETGLWGSDSPLLPAKPFPGFERAQAACAAQLAGRSVAWIADAGENGETDVIELDLADGRASIVAKVAFRETDEADPTVARIAWDAARNLLWLCSDAGTRVLRRLSA
jgi:hypothetical protein